MLLSRSAAEQSTDNPVFIKEDEQNKTGSEADLSNSYRDSTKYIAGLNSRQTSLDTTVLSSSIPQSYNVDHEVSRAAKLDKSSTLVTKTVYIKRVCSLLKYKTRNAEGRISGKSSSFWLLFACLIILQEVYQRVIIVAQIVTAIGRPRANLITGQYRRSKK
jgi:hypothetical protein